MNTVKVSIIVPVYNVEAYLHRCLTTLVNQTLKEIEIIVVNDGSTDHSQRIIDEFATTYPSLIFPYLKPNGGLGDARNFGLAYAKGEYVGYIDSDDYVELTMYEHMYEEAKAKDADLVVCDIEYVWESKKQTFTLNGLKPIPDISINKALFLSPIFAWNKLYRHELLQKLQLKYPSRLWYEDLPVSLPLFAYVNNVGYVKKSLVHYVQRENSIMNSKSNSKMFDIFEILNLVVTYFKDSNLYSTYKDELEYVSIEQLMLYGAFRFMRTSDYRNLVNQANKFLNSEFKHWKHNPYLRFLPLHYRFFVKTLNLLTLPIYTILVRFKSK